MITIETVLVATDFSEPSETALAYGRALARTFGADLHLLHVVESALIFAGLDGMTPDISALQKEAAESAWFKLNTLLTEGDRQRLNAVAAVRTAMAPAAEIIAYAGEVQADIIIVGTHGRGLVAHLLMGSVAEKVVRLAGCPVLTVRHPGLDAVRRAALDERALASC